MATQSASSLGKEKTKEKTKSPKNAHKHTASHHDYKEVQDNINKHYQKAKKDVGEWVDEGKKKIGDLHGDVEAYTEDLIKVVKENPLTSVLVAGGIGFVLSALLRK